jgi:hypothetical protein
MGNEYHRELERKQLDARRRAQRITSESDGGNNVDKAESEHPIVDSLQHMDDPCSVESD